MRASRGMGDMKASKMPKGKKVIRKDDPNEVTMYAKGGKAPGKLGQRARFAQLLKGFKKGK